jgi:aminoglycoside phosphotransferase family enzyme
MGAVAAARGDEPSIADKVAFLRSAATYPHAPERVEVIETHMAWVFLAGQLAFKMKKPVRYDFLDFTSLAAREFTCREELRLNRRLAPGIYLDVMPLTRDAAGRLNLEGAGTTVEWLVKMKRLPAHRMLDAAIAAKTVKEGDITRVGRILVDFYRAAKPVWQPAETVIGRFAAEHHRNADLLSSRQFDLDRGLTDKVLRRMSRALEAARPLLARRIADGTIVEGHGDLRPEHICLVTPPVIIDCLEFNRDLRLVDPFDEIAYLDLECQRLAAAWIGAKLLDTLLRELPPPPPALVAIYHSSRALLRARLALAHLTEPDPRTPAKWEPRARAYIELAEAALTSFEGMTRQ